VVEHSAFNRLVPGSTPGRPIDINKGSSFILLPLLFGNLFWGRQYRYLQIFGKVSLVNNRKLWIGAIEYCGVFIRGFPQNKKTTRQKDLDIGENSNGISPNETLVGSRG
jgi:hypothetical protein